MYFKKVTLFIYLNNSVIYQPIFIKFDTQDSEEECYKYFFFKFCPPRLKTVTTLPCEIPKTYFSSLQQYNDVRNVTDSKQETRDKLCQSSVWSDLLVHEHRRRVFLPLINCFVYNTQLEASRDAHRPVPQICHALYWNVVDAGALKMREWKMQER